MAELNFQQFDAIYQESVTNVFAHWTPEMQTILAKHCHAWGPGLFDFRNYLQASSLRFFKAYRSIADNSQNKSVCDVGGFWGVFPLTLKKIGYQVSMTESLQYYGESFKALFNNISDNGVSVFDYDPFDPNALLEESFDVVTVMAVLEHYPHSLKPFMENVRSLVKPGGSIYLEVPNIAYWPKRIALMRGESPHAQLMDIYMSDVPFIGHHHEFTISELRALVRTSGLSIQREEFYNYTPGSLRSLRMLLRSPFQFLAFSFLRESRECLAVSCKVEEPKK